MLCTRCHANESKVKICIVDNKSGREFSQRFCPACADEILRTHPEASKELKDAQAQGRPVNITSPPPEWIPEEYRKLIRRRAGP